MNADLAADKTPTAECLRDAACQLEFEKRRFYEEIRNYPTPITACDQQFNYLLEQQARVTAELSRVRSPCGGSIANRRTTNLSCSDNPWRKHGLAPIFTRNPRGFRQSLPVSSVWDLFNLVFPER